MILHRVVLGNDVKDHGEHANQDSKEEHEHLEIDNDINDHLNNIAEVLHNTHKEEGLDEAEEHHPDHDGLRDNPISIGLLLHVDIEETQQEVGQVDVVPWISEVFHALFVGLGSVVE